MKHGYFAAFGCACLLGLALISCDPVGAVEIGVDDQTGIYDYLDTGAQNLQQIDFSLDSDEDGNRSIRLKIYGLQKLALSEQSGIYENMDFSVAPDTVTVSGSGCSALYRNGTTNVIQPVTLSLASSSAALGTHPFISAPDFVFSFTSSDDPNATYRFTLGSTNSYNTLYNLYSSGIYSGTYTERVYSPTGLFADFQRVLSTPVSFSYTYYIENNTIPTITQFGRFDQQTVGGLGQNITLPPGTIDSQTPWNYYNNVLLPYMEEEFPGYDEYFIFPDGFTPSEPPPQVPTEYPTLPGYDFDIQPNGTLPADAGNTAFDMPDVPVKVVPVPSFDLTKINPAEIIAPFANGLQGIWALISDTLVSFDLLPVVSLCFLVLIITAFLALGVK